MRSRGRGKSAGQVMTEFALATMITVALGSILFLFYQGFVVGNLYGTQGEMSNAAFGLVSDNSFGLERVVALPFP
jgi:hypothetical protein